MWAEKTKEGNIKFREQYKNPLTGRYSKVSVTFDKNTNSTRRKAQIMLENKIQHKLQHIQDGNIKKGVTLGQVIKEWEPIYKANVRPNTWQVYIVAKKHIIKYIGLQTQVDKITSKYLIHIYEKMLYQDGYNNPTVKEVSFKMREILRFAFKRDYVRYQPEKNLDVNWKKNKHYDVSKKFLDANELAKVLDTVNAINPLYEQIFEWQYLTGMRIGETLALRVKDIVHNSNGYFANVNGTLNYTGTKVKDYVRQPTPKTDTSFRTIKLPDKAIKIYKARKKEKKRKTMTIFFKKITVGSLLQG